MPLLPAVVAREGRPLAGPGRTQRTVQGAAALALIVFVLVLVLVARTGRAESPRHGEGVATLALEADHLVLLGVAVVGSSWISIRIGSLLLSAHIPCQLGQHPLPSLGIAHLQFHPNHLVDDVAQLLAVGQHGQRVIEEVGGIVLLRGCGVGGEGEVREQTVAQGKCGGGRQLGAEGEGFDSGGGIVVSVIGGGFLGLGRRFLLLGRHGGRAEVGWNYDMCHFWGSSKRYGANKLNGIKNRIHQHKETDQRLTTSPIN